VCSEARHGDPVGQIGQTACERQRLGNVHGGSIREQRNVPMRRVWSES
jgi:hypothetical protein